MAPATAAYRRSVVSCRRHNAARHRDITGGDILPAADTSAVVAAFGRDRAAGDVDIVSGVDAIHVLLRFPTAAADTSATFAALSADCATINIDLTAATLIAAANTGSKSVAGGLYRTGVEIQLFTGTSLAAADACAAIAADGRYDAAPVVRIALRAEVHIHAVAVHISVVITVGNIAGRVASSYARRFVAALAGHRGACARQNIKLTLAAVFLYCRAAVGALQGAVLADEIDICRSLFVQLYGRPLGTGTHLDIYAVNKYVRRGFISLDEYLLIPCPCVPELIGNGRVDVVAPTVLNGDVRCPVVHVNAHVVLWYGIHRPVRCQYCYRQHGQHHAAQQQDAKYSFLHWLFSSFSCRFGLSVPSFLRFSLLLSRKHSAVMTTAAAKETTASST